MFKSFRDLLLISLFWTVCLASYSDKRQVYTQFAPPSAEKFFARQYAPAPAPLGAIPLTTVGQYGTVPPYGVVYNAIPSAHAFRQQYQYIPAPFLPSPYQVLYPQNAAGLNGPGGQIIYLNRVPTGPTPADGTSTTTTSAGSTSEQGNSPSSIFSQLVPNWPSSFPSNWGSFGNFIPSLTGSSEAESTTPSSSAEAGPSQQNNQNKNKPEKLESGTESQNLESVKLESEKIVAEQEPIQQQPAYSVLGYPQFFGHFAAFPSDKEQPTALTAATKGAISSFLFYKDQPQHHPQLQQQQQLQQQAFVQQPFVQHQQFAPQQQQPFGQQPQFQQVQQQQPQPQQLTQQKSAVSSESQANVGSAQIAYQRYLLLSKQRSDDIAKSGSTVSGDTSNSSISSSSSSQKDVQQQQQSNAVGAEPTAVQSKSSASGST